jgi:tetratricopeptide (TPR) repeat protein
LKPLEVNNTPFWNVNFNFAIGFIPTIIMTQGIPGFLAWLLLLAGLFLLGLKALLAAGAVRGIDKFVILSSLTASLYLWTFMILYVPGAVIIILTFILTGVFLGVMAYMNLMSEKNIVFGRDSITSFASALFISLLLLFNIALFYSIGIRYLSAVYFGKSLISINRDNNVELGEREAERALALDGNDRNYRLVSNIQILKINNLISSTNNNLSDDAVRAEFQNLLGSAVQNAQLATRIDESNYQNWLSLGSIYESIISLGIEGSYESAISSYQRAQIENPTNPEIDLILARTELENGDREKARTHIADALSKKNNYTEAVFLLSQIEIADGNINEAIRSSEAATLISPNDPTLFFQLGFLRYNQRNYQGAIEPLERAVGLNPPYSNAKYFLGLSYYNLGRTTEAIAQFKDLVTLNPENQEVKVILSNMERGLNALSGIEAEEREDLPVEEES